MYNLFMLALFLSLLIFSRVLCEFSSTLSFNVHGGFL